MTNVVQLEVLQGDGFHMEADDVLNGAVGRLRQCFIVGISEDGEIYMAGTDGCAESVFLMERAKALMIESDYGR